MSLAILLEPISISLFHHLVSQGPAAGCQAFAPRWGALTCARHAQGPSALAASLCLGTTAGCPGCEGFDDHCSAGLPGSQPPGIHVHVLLLPASSGFGLVLVFPSFTFPTPRISGSLQHPFPALSLSKQPYRQHLGFCVRSGWLWVRKVALAVEPVPMWLSSQGPDMRVWHWQLGHLQGMTHSYITAKKIVIT